MDEKTTIAIIAILLVVVFFVAAPFITIWSLNTLFGLGIGYTFWTWLAGLWLLICAKFFTVTLNGKKD